MHGNPNAREEARQGLLGSRERLCTAGHAIIQRDHHQHLEVSVLRAHLMHGEAEVGGEIQGARTVASATGPGLGSLALARAVGRMAGNGSSIA